MSPRPAQAAGQSDPAYNTQFRRWLPDGATGADRAYIRAWHASDVIPPMSKARRLAERQWIKLTQHRVAR
jgi:hypothetical protein